MSTAVSSHTPVTSVAPGTQDRPLRIAVIGSGPAGVYAADMLTKSEAVRDGLVVSIDLFDRYPAPYGLIRYGVAPDHPRIKGIVNALYKVLDRGDIRFFGNVDYGTDLSLEDLQKHYDAVIFATGAIKDADLNIPGIELDGSYGGADFVSWYDGHPDVSREWPLTAKEIAVIGNGNVALDVARVLSKHADDLLVTEIPDNVYAGLKSSPVTDVHIFGRRGPAQVKFTPMELRELSHSKDVDIVLYEEDFDFDEASDAAVKSNNQVKTMVNTLTNWLAEQDDSEDAADPSTGASRRLHLHFLHNPVEITGADGTHVPGIYATGWIKRGPVGLIGSTKGDALETITHLLSDREELPLAVEAAPESVVELLDSRGVEFTTWEGWLELDAHEKALGAAASEGGPVQRERIKVVPREDMVAVSRGASVVG